MRLMEVGTKQQSMGRQEEAYKLFNQAYDLYCLFWGLNLNLVDVKDAKWIADDSKNVSELMAKSPLNEIAEPQPEEAPRPGAFGKLKSVIRKAIDCCIE